MVTNRNAREGAQNVFTPVKISQVIEIVQNVIFDMLLWYNKAMI